MNETYADFVSALMHLAMRVPDEFLQDMAKVNLYVRMLEGEVQALTEENERLRLTIVDAA